jgi:hypothetical protein
MSETLAGGRATALGLRRTPAERASEHQAADVRRLLQLGLAAIWLLDGVLQFQPFMFTKAFASQIIVPTAQGNPAVVAHSITWAAAIIGHHPVGANAAFAVIQTLLGLAIAWRPTVRAALAASVVWALLVWWFGEGLGGVLTGSASPLSGAPGGVVLYALLAVLLWPTDRDGPFEAARAVGATAARALWLVLWGSLAYFALAADTGPQDLHDMITGMAQGQPDWLSAIMNHAAALVAHRGLAFSVALGVALALIAVAVLLPRAAARVLIVVALVVCAVIWVVGEALGGVFGGQGTDPNSGPLLALLALAYWPAPPGSALPGSEGTTTDLNAERTTS